MYITNVKAYKVCREPGGFGINLVCREEEKIDYQL